MGARHDEVWMADEARPGEGLRNLLTMGHDDERSGEHQPGLVEWYPTVVAWSAIRSARGGGGGKSAPLPMNADAYDFLAGRYWHDADHPMPTARTDESIEQLNDPANYQLGFEKTVLMLEARARAAFRLDPAPRLPHDVHQPRPDVLRALQWVADVADVLADQHAVLAVEIYDEARRLAVHARSMAWGARLEGGASQCPYCHNVESVWSDGERAVCVTPICRWEDGSRRCWQLLDVRSPEDVEAKRGMPQLVWHEVPEPDPQDGGDRLSDEDLERLQAGRTRTAKTRASVRAS